MLMIHKQSFVNNPKKLAYASFSKLLWSFANDYT